MAKKLKQTYPIKDNGVNGEGGTRQAAARMKEEEERISMANQRKKKEDTGMEGGTHKVEI